MRVKCTITMTKKEVLEALQDSVDAKLPPNATLDLDPTTGDLMIDYDTDEVH